VDFGHWRFSLSAALTASTIKQLFERIMHRGYAQGKRRIGDGLAAGADSITMGS